MLHFEVELGDVDLSRFDTYPKAGIRSESQALDFALISSLLRTFIGDPSIQLTIRGRLRSGNFGINLAWLKQAINISGVQIEVDAGYEGEKGLYLFEAKSSLIDDFHIRQLLFPYKEWQRHTPKPVIPIFFAYTNGKYYLAKLRFGADFGDVTVDDARCFTINTPAEVRFDVLGELNSARGREVDVPYPQADDVDKVADLVECLAGAPNGMSPCEVAEHFEMDIRQGGYYANAVAYLGFASRAGNRFVGNESARSYAAGPIVDRQKMLARAMFSRPSLKDSARLLITTPSEANRIPSIVRRYRKELNQTTANRRAQTVRCWVEWIQRTFKQTAS